jgi:ABC-2 type transport system ATP-binding protein
MKVTLSVDNLFVTRDNRPVLDGIGFEVQEGTIIGLLGPSGAGKTTLMRAIMGLQRISSGRITVLGQPAGSPALRSMLGYVTQSPAIYNDLTVAQNLHYFGAICRAPRAEIETVMDKLGLTKLSDRLVEHTSGGQRTRVSLAVALLGKPKLLILDEPTVGLDPIIKAEIWAYLKTLAGQGITMVVSSHVMDEADHCDQLILLREGRMIAYGTDKAIKQQAGASTTEEAFIKLVEQVRA